MISKTLIIGYSIYMLIALVHLTFAYLEKEKLRKVTKPFLMASLLTIVIILTLHANIFNHLLIMAICFGLIGDIFLLFDKSKTLFTIGGISFFMGHLFYIINDMVILDFSKNFKSYWYFSIILIIMFILWFAFSFKKILPYLKKLTICCIIYSFILFVGVLSSVLTIINGLSITGVLLFIGFALFIISDTILVYDNFVNKIKRSHFYLMLPYILAQGCIVLALILA